MSVFYFGFHSETVWAFTRPALELARQAIIDQWDFPHSPAEAVSVIKECPLDFIDRSDKHASYYI